MQKRLLLGLVACFLFASGLRPQDVRRASVAGLFYDSDPRRLAARINEYLSAAEEKTVSGEILALIVPHAGYTCSGPTAALAYRLIKGRPFEAVVILGPTHNVDFEGCSVYPRGGYETPLGVAAVDEALAAELMRQTGFGALASAHGQEHSLEVQVPFLQTVLPGVPIVPVVMGRNSRRTAQVLAEGLAKARAKKKFLVVASTDLSHQLSKSRANAVDAETIRLIRGFSFEPLFGRYERYENVFCGGGAVLAAMLFAQKRGEARVEVLGYSDSSTTCGPERSVVGYLAAALTSSAAAPAGPLPTLPELTAEEKKELLQAARRAVSQAVRENSLPSSRTSSVRLNAPGAAFVTLTKRGELRGCIGTIEPVAPLLQTVVQTAALAALQDRRFDPVTEKELPALDVEVTVLSPLTRISDPRLVQVGKHGLVISHGTRRGLLLPQVATNNGWDREEFLRQACLKAGLPPDDWRRGADIDVFEAIIIH